MPSNNSGHLPLTYYERTKKFKDSNYGTTATRLSGDTQVAFGHCSLSLAPIRDDNDDNANSATAMVTPSGHLYGKQAIYEYLLTRTAEYKQQLAAHEQQQRASQTDVGETTKQQRQDAFEESNHPTSTKKRKPNDDDDKGKNSVLKRTSYWLPDMQPDKVDEAVSMPDRPASPYSNQPLKRKDLRELVLTRKPGSDDCLCAISGKAIRMQPVMAYWVKDKKIPGVVVLKEVYEMTVAQSKKNANKDDKSAKLICPLTNQKIKHTIELKSGGSGFAAHNAVEVKTYRPTIT